MAINRLKIAQPEGDPKTVAFTDDILLNGLTGSGLITVTGEGKAKTVSTDPNKLTLDNDNNVKVATPLVIDNKTTPSTTTNKLYSVGGKLYWNGQLVDSHEPGTGYVTQTTFNNTIGSWSTGSTYENSTVKAAIENISAITGFRIIDHRPVDGTDTGEKNTIYLFKPQGKDSYEEWIYVEVSTSPSTKKWEKIGDTDIKLTDYYTKLEIDAKVDDEETRATGVESGLNTRLTTAEGKLTGITGTVKAYVDAKVDDEETRATGVESGLNTRLTTAEGKITTAEGKITTIEGKLTGITDTVKAYVDAEKTRATGVEGTLNSLTTDAKGNLVAAINEVDSHANTAQSTAEGRLASITGNDGGGVEVSFSTNDTTKAVTTTVSVTESTLGTNSKFNASDKNVATGAKVQAAIDAAEQRAKTAQTYTGDNVTIQVTNNTVSAKTAAVAVDGTALTTGGQVYTAIDTAKTALTGSAIVTGPDITIKGAMHEAEAAQTAIGTLSSLSTAAKNNLVAAINEVDTNADAARTAATSAQSTADTNSTAIGTLNSLTTDAKTNLVAAINEVDAHADAVVQDVKSGDTFNIQAVKSDSTKEVTITPIGNLATLLSNLSIVQEQ